ncbi:MAG: DUF4271 domain-containing protein [Bacteroidetes bacterium]|nr:DUF4271 domain-containing protein [Bacteroidota bacterium]
MHRLGSGNTIGFFFRAKGEAVRCAAAFRASVLLVLGLVFLGLASAQRHPDDGLLIWPADSLAADSADRLTRQAVDPRVWDQLHVVPPGLRPVVEESDLQPLRLSSRQVVDHKDWLFLWLLGLVVLLAVIRVQFARDVREWWRALWNRNLAHQLQRDREFALTPHGLLLFLLFSATLGTWCWLVLLRLRVTELPGLGNLTLLACVVAVMFVFFIRDALRRLTGLLFRAEEEMAFFGFEITLLQALAGGMLLPFLFVIGFAPDPVGGWGVLTSVVLLLFLFGWRSLRGLQVGSGSLRHNGFAFVVYICTLEIAPIAVAIKGITSWLSIG